MEIKEINLPKPTAKFFVFLSIFLLVAGLSFGSYYFYKYQKSKVPEVKTLVAKVGKLMLLPTDEDPSVATIVDIEKLKDQAFFTKAQNGDKTLIYNNAKIAILYSPKRNLILNVSPISVNPEAQNLKVALYNGTNVVGLTQTAESNLKGNHKEFEIIKRANAARNNYEKSIVIDLTGSNSQIAALLASEINGEVTALPEGETKPTDSSIDLLVILGKNYPSTSLGTIASPSPTP